MKTILMTTVLFATTSAFAHGNLAAQAHDALTVALKLVQTQEPKETLRNFKSVSAEKIAHETFAVVVSYTNQTSVNYVCQEDESVEPVVWACTKK
ncbi:MAG: hypothetical protein ACAH59_03135 [Pseudobdellovibrionaceae bacterium]